MQWEIVILSGTYGIHNPEVIKMLNELGNLTRIAPRRGMRDREIVEALIDADVVILGSTVKMTSSIIKQLPKLRVIARHGVGLENVDLKAATERGIIVIYTRHANAESVAEHTFALMLGIVRRLYEAVSFTRKGEWQKRSQLIGIELRGKKLGIIGLGAIGRRVAEIAKAFGMEIIAYDPYISKDIASRLGVELVNLDTLLKEADIVSIHAALTKETYHMIGEKELKLMKPTAILINTARGAIIDETALIKALKEGWIMGAALDVFEEEPPPKNHPLLKLNNVIITPHIAAFTHEAIRRMDLMIVEDLKRIYHGLKPLRIANPKVLEKLNLRDEWSCMTMKSRNQKS